MKTTMTYEIIQPPFSLQFREMGKGDLKKYFDWFISQIPIRIKALESVVHETPEFEHWKADLSEESLVDLGKWFAFQVETRDRTEVEKETIIQMCSFPIAIPGQELTNKTFSIAIDVGMYFADVLKKQLPSLEWGLEAKNKKFADYGQPILGGFGSLSLNPVRIMVNLAYGIAGKQQTGQRLPDLYAYWANIAKSNK